MLFAVPLAVASIQSVTLARRASTATVSIRVWCVIRAARMPNATQLAIAPNAVAPAASVAIRTNAATSSVVAATATALATNRARMHSA